MHTACALCSVRDGLSMCVHMLLHVAAFVVYVRTMVVHMCACDGAMP